MITKLLIGSLLALTTLNTIAGNIYIHKDKAGQELLTDTNDSSSFNQFSKTVKTTYYRDTEKDNEGNSASTKPQTVSRFEKNENKSNSASYANSAYNALR